MLAEQYASRQLVGVDASSDMVAAAMATKAGSLGKRLRLLQGDVAAGLVLDDGSAALVFNMNCVYFWSDLEAACRELYRVTAPGGLVATVMLPHPVVCIACCCRSGPRRQRLHCDPAHRRGAWSRPRSGSGILWRW